MAIYKLISVTKLDDKAYTYVMCAYALMQERRANVLQKKQTFNTGNLLEQLSIRKPVYR